MDWTAEKIDQLIEEFKEQPLLWDPNSEFYHHKQRKADAWAAISKNLECSVAEAKKKMESILGSYRRERCKVKKHAQEGRQYVSRWFAWSRMQFLMQKFEPRNHQDFMEEMELQFSSDLETKHTVDFIDYPTPQQDHTVDTKYSDDSEAALMHPIYVNSTEQVQRKRKASEYIESHDYTVEGEIANKAAQSDECSVYAQHVANKMRCYPVRTLNIVQHHINNILFNADMGRYENESQTVGPVPTKVEPGAATQQVDPYANSNGSTHLPHYEVIVPTDHY